VYGRLQEAQGNNNLINQIIRSQPQYPSLFTTCPQMSLIQCEFSVELPFVIERDPEMVKHSGWLVAGVREIEEVTGQRNRNIESAANVINFREGAENLYSFQSAIQLQTRISNTECIVALQLFEVLIRLGGGLEKVNEGYSISAKKSRFTQDPRSAARAGDHEARSNKTHGFHA
jgi:hypothetical protein